MKRGQLIVACLVALGLFGAVLMVESGSSVTPPESGSSLLGSINADSLRAVELVSGESSVRIARGEKGWVVPARDSYPAEPNKVRSLLLKLFNLGNTQKLPATAESYEKLGVAEDSYKEGYAKVQFFAESDENPVSELYLGAQRNMSEGPGNGQYLRTQGQDVVHLSSSSFELDVNPASWLASELVNVRQSSVYKVEQYRVSPEGEASLEYEFSRGLTSDGQWGLLRPVENNISTDESYEEPVISQVRGLLENVRLSDVRRANDGSDEEGFDRKTIVKLKTGIAYSIFTKVEEDSKLARLEVARPLQLIDELKELRNKSEELKSNAPDDETADKNADKNADENAAKDTDKDTTADTDIADGEDTKDEDDSLSPLKVLATEPEANELNQRFAGWVFVLPDFQANKFRYTAEDLLKKEAPAQ